MKKDGIHKFKPSSIFVNNSGFTLIELLLVIVIIGIMASASFGVLNRYARTQNSNIGYEDMKTKLYFAKSSALSQVLKNCISTPTIDRVFLGYEFKYDRDNEQYWVEEVCNPAVPAAIIIVGGRKETLPTGSVLNGSGVGTIRFKPLDGGTTMSPDYTDIVIQSGTVRTIRVYKSGVIEGRND